MVYTWSWGVGDGRCKQSHHHLPHAFNITGEEDWIHPSSVAVMANRRRLNNPKRFEWPVMIDQGTGSFSRENLELCLWYTYRDQESTSHKTENTLEMYKFEENKLRKNKENRPLEKVNQLGNRA